MSEKLPFASDYMEGAHPRILEALAATNFLHSSGYGTDEFCRQARQLIREACGTPGAAVEFLVGGTQTNAVIIDGLLKGYQGVISAESGHIAVHEAGAVEFTGHKVITLPAVNGKLNAGVLENYMQAFRTDANNEHMVSPGAVYISQPTEYGTLYSLEELEMLAECCHRHSLYLYCDGARLAYGLASKANDVGLGDLARLCDAFYIGGTKCGTMFGEAVVVRDPASIAGLFSHIKQHGALLAKGRLYGVQFSELFRDGLYYQIGRKAVEQAERITAALKENGYRIYNDSPTNQRFFIIEDEKLAELEEKVGCSLMDRYDDGNSIVRLCTSWATDDKDVESLIRILAELK